MKLLSKPLPVGVLVLAPWFLAQLIFYTSRDFNDPMYFYYADINSGLSNTGLMLAIFATALYALYTTLKDFSWQAAGVAYTVYLTSAALSTTASLINANTFVKVMKHFHGGIWEELVLLGVFFFLAHQYFHHCEYIGECFCRWWDERKKIGK